MCGNDYHAAHADNIGSDTTRHRRAMRESRPRRASDEVVMSAVQGALGAVTFVVKTVSVALIVTSDSGEDEVRLRVGLILSLIYEILRMPIFSFISAENAYQYVFSTAQGIKWIMDVVIGMFRAGQDSDPPAPTPLRPSPPPPSPPPSRTRVRARTLISPGRLVALPPDPLDHDSFHRDQYRARYLVDI